MSITKKVLRKTIFIAKNFYLSTGLFLLIWVSFFDANDFISQYQLTGKLHDLQEEKEYYTIKIKEVKFEKEELLSSTELLIKFARERYLMKKPNEDVYVCAQD